MHHLLTTRAGFAIGTEHTGEAVAELRLAARARAGVRAGGAVPLLERRVQGARARAGAVTGRPCVGAVARAGPGPARDARTDAGDHERRAAEPRHRLRRSVRRSAVAPAPRLAARRGSRRDTADGTIVLDRHRHEPRTRGTSVSAGRRPRRRRGAASFSMRCSTAHDDVDRRGRPRAATGTASGWTDGDGLAWSLRRDGRVHGATADSIPRRDLGGVDPRERLRRPGRPSRAFALDASRAAAAGRALPEGPPR